MDKLTDEIVEDIISRVAHCTDHVQTVFLEQGLVHCCNYYYYYMYVRPILHYNYNIISYYGNTFCVAVRFQTWMMKNCSHFLIRLILRLIIRLIGCVTHYTYTTLFTICVSVHSFVLYLYVTGAT